VGELGGEEEDMLGSMGGDDKTKIYGRLGIQRY